MSEAIIVALITGGLTLIGTIATIMATTRRQAADFRISQAVMEQKIETLTAEVHKHNGFAERLPVVENDIKTLYHEVKELKEANK